MKQHTTQKTRPVRQRASIFPYRGKFRVQYVDTFGRERTKTVESERSGHLFLAGLADQVASGYLNLANREVPYFSQWLDFWLSIKEQELSPTTTWGYRSHINNYLVPAFGNLRLDQITTMQLANLYRQIQSEHGLSPGTIKKLHSLISGAFAMAEDQGVITHSPVTRLKPPRYAPKVKDVYSNFELQKLLKTASEQPSKAHLRWLLALRYGLRQGEVLGLKTADFNLAEKTLTISRTVNSLPSRGVVELPLKSKSSRRSIPVDEQTIALVAALENSKWIFQSDHFEMPIDASTDRRAWVRLAKQAGVRVLPLHSARHSVATDLISKGVNPRAVQILLGHSSPAYTLATYVNLGESELRAALRKQLVPFHSVGSH